MAADPARRAMTHDSSAVGSQEIRAEAREEFGASLEECRRYLLLMANQAMDPDLSAKIGASDLVQETFLEAHRHFGKVHCGSRAALLAWLRWILECRVANARRHFRATGKCAIGREVALDDDNSRAERLRARLSSPGDTPRQIALRREQVEALDVVLQQLP